jgi:hypothetical protein
MDSLPYNSKRRKKIGLYPSDAPLLIVNEFLKSRNPKFRLFLILRCDRFVPHFDAVSIPGTGMAQQVHIPRIATTLGSSKSGLSSRGTRSSA